MGAIDHFYRLGQPADLVTFWCTVAGYALAAGGLFTAYLLRRARR